jgi:hypothetical protein
MITVGTTIWAAGARAGSDSGITSAQVTTLTEKTTSLTLSVEKLNDRLASTPRAADVEALKAWASVTDGAIGDLKTATALLRRDLDVVQQQVHPNPTSWKNPK